MCSLSWVEAGEKLSIIFNRDEQLLRAEAIPPKIFSQKNNDNIMPIDPQGHGSWISVNQKGIVLALLNYYQYQEVKELNRQSKKKLENEIKSRGLLVKNLSQAENWKDFQLLLKATNLNYYQAFSLAFISKTVKRLLKWNGKQLDISELPPFYTSSGFNTESVCDFRHRAFEATTPLNEETLNLFHRSHQNKKGAYSICMHREDAKTVSLSCIQMDKTNAIFNYWNGSPCVQKISTETTIKLNL